MAEEWVCAFESAARWPLRFEALTVSRCMTPSPHPPPQDRITSYNLRVMRIDAVFWSVMFGVGEQYFQPFGVALRLSPFLIGLMATLPPLLGAAIQLFAPSGVRAIGSLKRWIVLCVATQALAFVPLVIGAARGQMPATILFAALTIYFAAALSSAPAWTTWVGTLVPARIRVRYFSRRSRLIQIAMFIAFLSAGYSLEFGKRAGCEMFVFVALFAVAGAARGISACLIRTQSEAQLGDQAERSISWAGAAAAMRARPALRFLLFVVLLQSVVQVAHPFITPYLLQLRGLSYDEYVISMSAIFIAKIVTLAPFGALATRFGAGALLMGGAICLAPIPLLLLPEAKVGYYFVIQFFHGAAWAAVELGTLLLMLERIPEVERTSLLTKYNLLVYLAMLIGSTIGGAILQAAPGETAYANLFSISALLRGMMLIVSIGLVRFALRGRPQEGPAA